MKKIFVMAVMAAATLTANAQWWAGGSFALNFDNNGRNGDQNTTSFEIAPEVGYNLSDNWAVAIALGFGTTNNAAVSEGVDSYYGGKLDEANNYFKVAPYARYTFAKTGPVAFFVDGGVGFKFFNHDRGTQFNVGVRPGIAFNASKKVSLVAALGYLGYQKDSEKAGDGSRFGLGVDNKISFAAYYNF
jgi:hypothetical protein